MPRSRSSFDEESVEVPAMRSCPLLKVLSSFVLWCPVLDGLLQELNKIECKTVGYAKGITSEKFGRSVSEVVQGTLSKLILKRPLLYLSP